MSKSKHIIGTSNIDRIMNIFYNIKLFLRIVNKHKSHYIINLSALAICVSSFLIITSYTSSQKSYDSFHENKDRIFRLINVRHYPTKVDKSAGCIEKVGPELKASYPEVEDYAHCIKRSQVINKNGQDINEPNIYYTTPSFLQLFTFPIIKGNKTNYLEDPFTCLISESIAKKYFGEEDPIGKQLNFVYEKPVLIEGVMKDIPSNSYFNFDILVAYSTIKSLGYCETCNNKNTFIMLHENSDKDELEAKFPEMIKRLHSDDEFKREYILQSLSKIHQTSIYRFEIGKTTSGKVLVYLTVIAMLILFISWFNYISVNSIVSLKRLNELGVKSILGAKLRNIFIQFFLESLIAAISVCILGYGIAAFLLPFFSQLFSIDFFVIPVKIIGILANITVLGALITTIVPFILYKKIRSVNLYNLFKSQNNKSSAPRTVFIIVQYVIATLLITFSVLTYKQYKYMVDGELGFNSDKLFVVKNLISNSAQSSSGKVFIDNLSKYPEIEEVGYTSYKIGSENGDVGGGFHLEGYRLEESIQLYEEAVSDNFFDLLKINILVGNTYISTDSKLQTTDNEELQEIVLNETAVKQFGFENYNDIIGKNIVRDDRLLGQVIGVVKDYHQQSLDKPIFPTFYQNSDRVYYFRIKIRSKNIAQTLEIIKKEYKKISPSGIFDYYFLDDFFEKQYSSYSSFLNIIILFTFLAIIISSMGLFSLMKYIIYIRTKEIGVRKVNGAKNWEILSMLNKDILKWAAIAFIIATPIAYYAMSKWLENFAYKTNLSWWIFAIAGVLAISIAIITVSWQSWRAASRNPVEALRYE